VHGVEPVLQVFGARDFADVFPRRARTAHKGSFGHVLVVGGNHGMGGAARLAGEAALRSGAGLVTVATRPANVSVVTGGRPELMCRGVESGDDLDEILERATVVALGPGLGQDKWAAELYARVVRAGRACVVDADALNLLAQTPSRRDDWILTPHPGEAGRLLGRDTAAVQADRPAALAGLTERFGGAVVLKGRATLVGQSGRRPFLIRAGNPGMATGGMGDVLTGLVAGLLAQCDRDDGGLQRAAAAGAWVHACAGDAAAEVGERGLIATDLFRHLRSCLNP